MKILVIQLARFGDILQTWPTLRALKRSHPEASLHMVVRKKFVAAAEACSAVDKIIPLDSATLLEPCFSDADSEIVFEDCMAKVDEFIAKLDDQYDKVINLSYSPVSSHLNFMLSERAQETRGYTRFQDGAFALVDDASSYFFAQVGVNRANRLHLTDIFAATAGEALTHGDFAFPAELCVDAPAQCDHLVIHVGASEARKCLPKQAWAELIQELTAIWPHTIYLVGAKSERLADEYELPEQAIDLCGSTEVADLFRLVRSASGLIACDSMLIQIANLCQTPSVNLSHESVSFWETGPRVQGSRILRFADAADLDPTEVACVVSEMLTGTYLFKEAILVSENYNHEAIIAPSAAQQDFQWGLIQALYFNKNFPVVEDLNTYRALVKIQELADLGSEQIANIRQRRNMEISSGILSTIDDLMDALGKYEPKLSPLVHWFSAEKLRIGPGELSDVIDQSEALFATLRKITDMYVIAEEKALVTPLSVEEIKNGNLTL